MFSKGDLVNVNPRWTNRGAKDTVYIITGMRWGRTCLELELLDPLGDGRTEIVSEYHVQKLKVPHTVNT